MVTSSYTVVPSEGIFLERATHKFGITKLLITKLHISHFRSQIRVESIVPWNRLCHLLVSSQIDLNRKIRRAIWRKLLIISKPFMGSKPRPERVKGRDETNMEHHRPMAHLSRRKTWPSTKSYNTNCINQILMCVARKVCAQDGNLEYKKAYIILLQKITGLLRIWW